MDEKTPHLHATVVPIVTTERLRKKREGEKKYECSGQNNADGFCLVLGHFAVQSSSVDAVLDCFRAIGLPVAH